MVGRDRVAFRAFCRKLKPRAQKAKTDSFSASKRPPRISFTRRVCVLAVRGRAEKSEIASARDQAEKIYVQHRMLENAPELFDWLESGAIFYVRGDASRTAKDVDTSLHQIVEKAGSKTQDQAKNTRTP